MKFNLTTEQAISDFDNFVEWAERAWKQGQDVGQACSARGCPVAVYLQAVSTQGARVGPRTVLSGSFDTSWPLPAPFQALVARIDKQYDLWEPVDAYWLQQAAHQVKSAFLTSYEPDREAEREAWWAEKEAV